MALAYIDARTVMDRLDAVCGADGWQCNYTPGMSNSIVCNIAVKIGDEWVWKADGAGATDYEGEKGALSDAFKRAAVKWGIGRYLYELEAPWVEVEAKGKSVFIKQDAINKLDEIYNKHVSRAGWGNPGNVKVYRLLLNIVKTTVTQAADAAQFKEDNAGLIGNLPVKMRNHLMEELDRIGA